MMFLGQLLFALLIPKFVSTNLDVEHPIIYEILNRGPKSSYFGMSVAIRPRASILQNIWAIQIGAPRGNVDGLKVKEPGAVYRCHMLGPCRMIRIDDKFGGGKGIYAYKDKKDGAWVGVSMDIKDFISHEVSIVCGHRWINQNLKNPENIDITYLMTGVCYLQKLTNDTSEAPVQKLLPLVNTDKIYYPKPYVVDLSTYHWGLGQAGISVKLIPEPSNVIIGAPGVTHWVGSVVRYDSNWKLTVGNFAKSDIVKKNRYTYLGYAITAGKFFKDKKLWYVAGAPRSANYHGEVFVFQYQGSTDNMQIHSKFVGSTFGEYFGSSLTTSDVNGDGMDDLIVGAPLYSNKDPEEGRIYVYLGTNQANFLVQSQVIDGQIHSGRFGSCVTSLEDLDQDGFGDVAVGAPYEDNRKGAVYIYRGYHSGLLTEYSQRILAEEVYPYLRGFGISISPAEDVDGNKYKDIAIGAYLSEHVVLLRSRPVVSLYPKITTGDVPLIDRRDSYVNVSFCLRYTGSNAPNHTDVTRIIDVDPLYRRGSLKISKIWPFVKSIRLKANEITCEILSIYLDLSAKNYSPMQIILKSQLPPCQKNTKSPLIVTSERVDKPDGFDKWCPNGAEAENSKEIAFAGICGIDQVCRSDLKLSCDVAQFRTGYYTLASSEYLTLTTEIQNLGEPAQSVKLKIWANVKLTEPKTIEPPRNTYWLDLEGILTETQQSNFSFKIPFSSLEEIKSNGKGRANFTLLAEVFTSSIDFNGGNNRCRFSVVVESDASVSLYSSSSLTSSFIESNETASGILNVTHYYEVQKTGVTPLKESELTIYIPYYFHEEFLNFEIEASDWVQFFINDDEYPLEKNKVESICEENCPPNNRTLFLNCSTTGNKCRIVKIYFAGGLPTGLSSYIKILIFINTTAIDALKGDKDIIHISTMAIFESTEYLVSGLSQKLVKTASISLYQEDRIEGVDARVIGFSILAGGLLFSLVVTCLAKNDFFKRTKKEELKALKEANECFVYFATKSEPVNSCSDNQEI